MYYALACLVLVEDTTHPPVNRFTARADLRVFGGSADAVFPRCPACGGPPWTFDLDLRVPADMTPGVKTFDVWVTDPEGNRRAATTAAVEIAAR